jgi:hypothetical protein
VLLNGLNAIAIEALHRRQLAATRQCDADFIARPAKL